MKKFYIKCQYCNETVEREIPIEKATCYGCKKQSKLITALKRREKEREDKAKYELKKKLKREKYKLKKL